MKIQIWNPTKGEDYVLRDHVTKRAFSSHSSSAHIAEVVGDFPWRMKCSELEQFFEKTAIDGKGFFSVCPWSPGAKALLDRVKEHFSETYETEAYIYGYFESAADIKKLMDVRDAAGSFDSGEWVIGSCFKDFEDDSESASARRDLSFYLDNIENVGFLLSLSEMQQALLLVKHYDGTCADLDRLLAVFWTPTQ